MYKVLITTCVLASNGASASSIVVEFSSKRDAEEAEASAAENSNPTMGLFVTAVFLNPQ